MAVLVSGALLAAVLSRLATATALERLSSADLRWLAASALLSGVVLGMRGMRFSALMQRPDPGAATAAVAAQGFLTRVTPFRLGEFAMPYLLGRYAGEDAGHTLVALLLVRLIDLCLISGAGTVGAIAFAGPSQAWQGGAAALLVALALLLFGFRSWLRLGTSLAMRVATAVGLARIPAVARTGARLEEMLANMAGLTRGQHVSVAAWSIGIFVVQTVLLGMLPRAFGVQLEPLQLLIGASIAQIGAALPIASVGSFGTLEVAWVAGFVWVGVAEDDAIVTAVAAQVLTLGYSAVFAGLCWLYLDRRGRSPERAPAR